MPVFKLPDDQLVFPHPDLAEPDGLLALGGDLSPERLLLAYSWGIFPWYSHPEPILWWTPDPRMVLFPGELKISRSMRPYLNQQKFELSLDADFENVIKHCQQTRRPGQSGTWLTKEMTAAYIDLHRMGFAHSVEVKSEGKLVGGLYGVSLGRIFFGESMFSLVPNASKFGFIKLVQLLKEKDFLLIDCQQQTRHLASLGARPIPRSEFLEFLQKNTAETIRGNWQGLLMS